MNVGKRIDEEVAPHLIHELRRRSPCISCHDTASSPRRISSLSKMASTTPNVASLAPGLGPVRDAAGVEVRHQAPPVFALPLVPPPRDVESGQQALVRRAPRRLRERARDRQA